MKNWIPIAIGLAGLGLGWLVSASTDPADAAGTPDIPPTEREHDSPQVHSPLGSDRSAEIRRLQREIEALSAGQEALYDHVEVLTADVDMALEEGPQGAGSDGTEDLAAEMEINLEEMQLQSDHLHQWLLEQHPDPEWTASAEEGLRSTLQGIDAPGLDGWSTACGAEACRVDLRFTNGESRDGLMGRLPFLLPWSGEGFVDVGGEQGLDVVLYLSREGRSLPRVGAG